MACSEKAAEFLYPRKYVDNNEVKYINCIIDIEKFRFDEKIRIDWRKKHGLGNGEIAFLNVGRLQHQKNHYFLLELFNEIQKAIPGKLYIIGEGSELEGIQNRIKELQLDESVVLVGKTREVEKYMFMSDIFLLPSFHEGNPIVTAEAQAAGLPYYISDRVTTAAKVLDASRFIGIVDAKKSASIIVDDICEKNASWIEKQQ